MLVLSGVEVGVVVVVVVGGGGGCCLARGSVLLWLILSTVRSSRIALSCVLDN